MTLTSSLPHTPYRATALLPSPYNYRLSFFMTHTPCTPYMPSSTNPEGRPKQTFLKSPFCCPSFFPSEPES
ncbi:hypothetical protein E2C01_062695 [Portunus trituberculatus]|uniref:Uncharacterized protein n=1 Tax=Portunus trituberculatus TaxID=210409 RepID=A0A5B7HEE2_PORTR|nr:hypothetical protein [Portunus trituberculatus]